MFSNQIQVFSRTFRHRLKDSQKTCQFSDFPGLKNLGKIQKLSRTRKSPAHSYNKNLIVIADNITNSRY